MLRMIASLRGRPPEQSGDIAARLNALTSHVEADHRASMLPPRARGVLDVVFPARAVGSGRRRQRRRRAPAVLYGDHVRLSRRSLPRIEHFQEELGVDPTCGSSAIGSSSRGA